MKLFSILMLLTGVVTVTSFTGCKRDNNAYKSIGVVTGDNSTADTSLTYVYKTGTEGYSCFRIPAIVRSKKGTLLAFAEARKNSCADNGDINLVVKRSMDNGITWDTTITIWNDAKNTCGNPVPVIEEQSGNIILLMTW